MAAYQNMEHTKNCSVTVDTLPSLSAPTLQKAAMDLKMKVIVANQ